MRFTVLILVGASACAPRPVVIVPPEVRRPEVWVVEAAGADTRHAALDAALGDGSVGWGRLAWLSDRIGARITGSAELEAAVAWAAAEMAEDGFDAVRVEPIEARAWERGVERVAVTSPVRRALDVLALGNSAATDGPLERDVVVVDDLDHLATLGEAVRDRVVLFDRPFTTYGESARIRGRGPAAASRLGAAAALVRSVTPVSLSTPHTGGTWFTDGATPIPAAAVTLEDAAWMRRLTEAGEVVRVSIELGPRDGGPVNTANVVGELRGAELPDEVVTIGCHLDSWDVGQGAQDDAAGCVVVWEAARALAALPSPLRRTLRVVLYTNEENGLAGGRGYAVAHAGETHVAVVESDTGAGWVDGFDVQLPVADPARWARLTTALPQVAPSLTAVGAAAFAEGFSGSDVEPLVESGALGFGVRHDTTGYWPIHHTRADTLDKIDPAAIRHAALATALLVDGLLTVDRTLLE
jgi:carboxypeptidase Q